MIYWLPLIDWLPLCDFGFIQGHVDKMLFLKKTKSDILVMKIYVDDIVFGCSNKYLGVKILIWSSEFKMSILGESKKNI